MEYVWDSEHSNINWGRFYGVSQVLWHLFHDGGDLGISWERGYSELTRMEVEYRVKVHRVVEISQLLCPSLTRCLGQIIGNALELDRGDGCTFL